MMTLENLRESAVQMFTSQMGKDKHYNSNNSNFAFVDGVTMYILPKMDIYEDFIENKGYIYDSGLYIPQIEF